MRKNKDDLNEEILLLKELLKDKDSISSEYKSYSDNFEQHLVEFEKNINNVFEEKLSVYNGNHTTRFDYFNMFFFMCTCWAITAIFAHYILR